MHCRHRYLDELEPATSQLVQDPGDVAGSQKPDRQDQHQDCPAALVDVSIVDSARDLGVVIDSRLMMSDQVAALCRAGYYQLRQLRPVARSLPEESAKTLVQAFISSRLDYCNSLRRLQLIQNAAQNLSFPEIIPTIDSPP